MRPDAGLHADQARRHVGKPCLHLAARPLLAQHNGTAIIEAVNRRANRDPVFGVIGFQSGSRDGGSTLASMILGSRGWDADCGNDCEGSTSVATLSDILARYSLRNVLLNFASGFDCKPMMVMSGSFARSSRIARRMACSTGGIIFMRFVPIF